MSYSITEIEGIGKGHANKLAKVGIKTTAGLLKQCADKKGRKRVAGETKIDEKQILRWTNCADLMRISGIGAQYSELLEAAGVDTVKELRKRNAANLTKAMEDASARRKKTLTQRVPPVSVVTRWVESAKGLDPVMTY